MEHLQFLSLPAEVRLPIYHYVCEEPSAGDSLLYVCHQTRREVMPFLLQRPRSFEGLGNFVEWASRAPPYVRKHIKDIHIGWSAPWWERISAWYGEIPIGFEEEPISPRLTTATTPEGWRQRWMQISGQDITEQGSLSNDPESWRELKYNAVDTCPITATWAAFSAFENLQRISLDLNGDESQSRDPQAWILQFPDPHYEFHQFLLEMIANTRPGIRELCFTTGPVALDFLRHFTRLSTLRFAATSITSSEETLAILQSLKHLDTLTVYQHPTPVLHFLQPARRLERPPAVTPEVVAQMNPLRAVEFICETKETIGSIVLFKKMINALHAHADTLESFVLRPGLPVEPSVVPALGELLPRLTKLKVLELCFQTNRPMKNEELNIPDTVEKCVIEYKEKKLRVSYPPPSSQPPPPLDANEDPSTRLFGVYPMSAV